MEKSFTLKQHLKKNQKKQQQTYLLQRTEYCLEVIHIGKDLKLEVNFTA